MDLWDHRSLMDRWVACICGRQIYNIKCFDLICISSSTRQTLQNLAEDTWKFLSLDARSIGMSFADNKTKTLHDRQETWGIGTTVQNLRFLGYWIETPDKTNRTAPPSYRYHLDHWLTKANFSFNTLRALTLRSNKALRTPAILRILEACTRSILLYCRRSRRTGPRGPSS